MSNILLALAERCEQSKGACRELDAAIWLACVPSATRNELRYTHKLSGKECVIDETRENGRLIVVPQYTASLDAALALLPVEYDWIIGNVNGRHGGTPYACVGSLEEVFADTPVLALCAAALRARKSHEPA